MDIFTVRSRKVKKDCILCTGVIVEVLPDTRFRVKLENDKVILGYASGQMQKCRIRVIMDDIVDIEINKYDKDIGRIVARKRPQ